MNITILPATLADWLAIKRIYIEGILTGNATFQSDDDLPGGEKWFAGKIAGLTYKAVNEASETVGWAALSPVSSRCVYEGVAEVSVYVAEAAWGQGVGSALMDHLINASEDAGIWTLEAGIFPENKSSIRLHEKFGFRNVGVREKLGQMNGSWRDVVLLERRSQKMQK